MKTSRFLAAAILSTAVLSAGAAQAQTCNPGIGPAYVAHQAEYTKLANALVPELASLNTQLAAVVDIPTYNTLLAHARSIVTTINTPAAVGGRVLLTLPDGTVVVDTSKADDLDCQPDGSLCDAGQRNGYNHFVKKNVNENHNSRIAVLDAQEWPCGFGLEAKFSSSTGQREIYVGVRLGTHLDSNGTVRASLRQ